MLYFAFVPRDLLLEEGAGAHVVRAASGLLDPCSTRVVLQQYYVTSKNIMRWAVPQFLCFKNPVVFFFLFCILPPVLKQKSEEVTFPRQRQLEVCQT